MESLKERRTIRKYQPKDIPAELLNDLLETAFRASTVGNMQVYSVIVTRDAERKARLAPAHFNQPMVKEAPAVVTFCADINRFSKWCRLRGAEPRYDNFAWFVAATIDTVIAAQNFCIEAEKLGLIIERKYKYISQQGYIICCEDRENRYELHRKIMEDYIGRKLNSNEIVHHKDGNKLNNDINNLEILTRSEHIKLHKEDLKRGRKVKQKI